MANAKLRAKTKAGGKSAGGMPALERPKKDPNERRIPINRVQAEELNARNEFLKQCQEADAGQIKAQLMLNSYLTAIQHGTGEKRPARLIAVERNAHGKYVLVLSIVKGA